MQFTPVTLYSGFKLSEVQLKNKRHDCVSKDEAFLKDFVLVPLGSVCVSYCDRIRCTNNAVQLYKKRTPDNCVK